MEKNLDFYSPIVSIKKYRLITILPIKLNKGLLRVKKSLKKNSNNPFLYLGFVLILLFFLVSFSFPQSQEENLDFFSSEDLYLSAKGSFSNPPSLRVVNKVALKGNSNPTLINPYTLASVSEEPRDEIREYVVKEGDTLLGIAKKFNISLSTVLWANDLTENSTLKIGQELIILPTSGVLYSVRKGDTLSEIAQLHEVKMEEIVSFNELQDENDIFVGDLLIIPGAKKPALPRVSYTPIAENYFIFPAQGIISQGAHGFSNNAVDIANGCGSPVVAAASGRVLRAGPIWIGGNRITVLHPNGVVTYYGHLSKLLVAPGQEVKAGDVIGYIGNTGYTLGATGCHLHFAVRGAINFLSNYLVGSSLSWK